MAVNVRKVSLAIGREELAWAERRARREGTSISAVLTEAARRMREAEERDERQLAAWTEIEAWVREGRPATAAELEAARRELHGAEEPTARPARRGGDRRRRTA